MPEVKYLVQVTSDNHNKFYKMIPQGNNLHVEYGRIGAEKFQTKDYPIGRFDSILREKLNKGYKDQTHLIQEAITIEETKKSEYKPIPDSVVKQIVERLQQMAKSTIDANYRVSSNVVTQDMIDTAQKYLNKLSAIKSVATFNKTLIELFETLPRKMKKVDDYLAKSTDEFSDIITHEQALLDVMAGQVIQKIIEEDTDEKDETKAAKTILEAMGLEITPITADEEKYIKKMLGDLSGRFKNAWKVKNIKTEKAFDQFLLDNGEKEIQHLWHGSRNENWWSIINQGLVLRPTNAVISGKMFGYGLYFANKANKSIGYTSSYGSRWAGGRSDSGFLSLYKVIYGTPFIVNKNYYSYSISFSTLDYDKLQKIQPGADSLHALKNVTGLREDEIIIYKENQATIEYLVEVSA